MGPIGALTGVVGDILAPKTPRTPTVATTPSRSDAEVQSAAVKARKDLRARSGRAATIATSSLGDTSAASVARKQLLGA